VVPVLFSNPNISGTFRPNTESIHGSGAHLTRNLRKIPLFQVPFNCNNLSMKKTFLCDLWCLRCMIFLLFFQNIRTIKYAL
jgi:hypothetical protein